MGRITEAMQRLRDAGNTLVVVEHDPAVMLAADRMIDMGPGPGERGGQIVFDGTHRRTAPRRHADRRLPGRPQAGRHGLQARRHRRHAAAGAGRRARAQPEEPVGGVPAAAAGVRDRRVRLRQVDAGAGHPGAGAAAPLRPRHRDARRSTSACWAPTTWATWCSSTSRRSARRRAPTRSATSAPGTASARSSPTRRWRAQRGYTAAKFSFNSGDGRCPTCGGSGFEHVEMQFLSDVYLRCPDCDGTRYRPEILEVTIERKAGSDSKFRRLNVADVLELTVSEAAALFANDRDVIRALQPIVDVGLEYVKLGQPVPTLSGGESQRLKLAGFLAEAAQVGQQQPAGAGAQGHAVPVRRAHHRPALRRHRQADARAAQAAGGRPLADRDRAQPRRDPRRRLADRPGPRRRRRRRPAGGRGAAGGGEAAPGLAHGQGAARVRRHAGRSTPSAKRGDAAAPVRTANRSCKALPSKARSGPTPSRSSTPTSTT